MQAQVGDRINVPGKHVGEATRTGEVREVRGADGGPPYWVRWDDGHEALVYPGAEAKLQPES